MVQSCLTPCLDLTAEFSDAATVPGSRRYRNIPILDLDRAERSFSSKTRRGVYRRGSEASFVYVHCKIGYSRTAAAAAAYLFPDRSAQPTVWKTSSHIFFSAARPPSIVVRSEVAACWSNYSRKSAGKISPRLNEPTVLPIISRNRKLMYYTDLIQLYLERTTALQSYWTLYVVIVGGLLAFSSSCAK